ncbi:MAG: pirin family protein [Acidimicrobiales bacterium]
MPAVTVENYELLSHPQAPSGAALREVRRLTTAPSALEGEGFPVKRAFAGVPISELDPFVHMDQMGEVDYGPGEPKGTPWHPHRGFETVTYMIDGIMQHQDSIGGGGVIADGATQWMTAGSGILHIERPPEHLVVSGGLFHGVQLWVNLPASQKLIDPRYQDIEPGAVALLSSTDGGALVRVIAGELGEHRGPGMTRTPITLVHATLAPGSHLVIPWRPDFNALVYALDGSGALGDGRTEISKSQLAVLGPGGAIALWGPEPKGQSALEVLILGGRPIGEPVAAYGPFVMNTRAELAQAFDDFRAGRLGTIPADHLIR